MEPVANESSEQKSSSGQREGVPWSEIIRPAMGGVITVCAAAYGIWKSKATDTQQMFLAVAVLALVSFVWLAAMAWRARRSGSQRWLGAACLAFVSLVYLGSWLLPTTSTPAPRSVAQADVVEAIERADVALDIIPTQDGSVRFLLQTDDVPASVDVEVTSRHEQMAWTQLVQVRDCRREQSRTICTLPALDYAPHRFMSISDRDDMIKSRTVVTYTPSEGCDHFAGRSLDLGIKLFLSRSAELISVAVGHDSDDLTKMNATNIALIGSYDSYHTYRLLQACRQLACGPVITLSSAADLRKFDGGEHIPQLFRLTSNNTARALELVDLLEREIEAEGKSRTIYIAYDDEGAGNATDPVYYAVDQARELQRALAQGLLIRHPNVDVRWVRFKHNGGEGQGRLVFRNGAPGERESPLPYKSYEELVRAIRATNDEPLKRIVFVARDFAIIQFGRAVQSEYASSNSANEDLLVHVPGPREVFEGVTRCLDRKDTDEFLNHFLTFSPYGDMDTVEGAMFKEAWHLTFPDEPVAGRAARIYDALVLTQQAVRSLDRKLREQSRYVDLAVYRHELRHELAAGTFVGTSGTYSFRGGEIAGSSQCAIYQAGLGLLPFPSLEELAKPLHRSQPRAGLGAPE